MLNIYCLLVGVLHLTWSTWSKSISKVNTHEFRIFEISRLMFAFVSVYAVPCVSLVVCVLCMHYVLKIDANRAYLNYRLRTKCSSFNWSKLNSQWIRSIWHRQCGQHWIDALKSCTNKSSESEKFSCRCEWMWISNTLVMKAISLKWRFMIEPHNCIKFINPIIKWRR